MSLLFVAQYFLALLLTTENSQAVILEQECIMMWAQCLFDLSVYCLGAS